MQKLHVQLKIFLIILSGSLLLGCDQFPPFPDWNPVVIFPRQDKKFACHLKDKEKLIFECRQDAEPIGESLEGYFCSSPKETQEIISWAHEARDVYERRGQ